MKTRAVILTSIILFACGICAGRVADGWKIIQITNRDFIDPMYRFAISGDNVGWTELVNEGGTQVFFYDGESVTQISSGVNCSSPRISGSNVVWTESISSKSQIMFWNGGSPTRISSGVNDCGSPQISGSQVVWMESISSKYQIMFWNGGTPTRISSGVNNCWSPQISGSNVVWNEYISSKDQIMFWNGGTPSRISSGTYSCGSPKISGGNVVWVENGRLMFWNGSAVIEIPDSVAPSGNEYPYCISGSTVVWGNDRYVKAWDGSEIRELWRGYKRRNYGGSDLSISGNHIAWWEAADTAPMDQFRSIHYSDSYSSIMVTDMPLCQNPIISGTNIYFLALDENYLWQIFLAQPDTDPQPDPLTADINDDDVVDMEDLDILASQWLREEENQP